MMKWKGLVAALGLLLTLTGAGPVLLAQDDAGSEPPEVDAEVPTPQEPEKQGRKGHNGLYLAVAAGSASTDDLDLSNETLSFQRVANGFRIPDQDFARAAVGWRLPEGKGDFRIVFNGYKEAEYELDSSARDERLGGMSTPDPLVGGPVLWWTLQIRDGQLMSQRTPPEWIQAMDDADMDAIADPEEVRNLAADRTISTTVPDNMQNQVQTVDLLYGREFGGRRYSSRWWGGFRAFEYKGNILAGAWLGLDVAGQGFTDGAFLRPLNISQDSSGFGPTGAWEVDFNFYDKGLVLYVRAQAALTFNSNEMDTGTFFTQVRDTNLQIWLNAEARLRETIEKSAWQNTAEAGVRIVLRNGLQLELGYSLTAYLDVVTSPINLDIPETSGQINQGTSALYATQDYVVDGWHAGVAFQF